MLPNFVKAKIVSCTACDRRQDETPRIWMGNMETAKVAAVVPNRMSGDTLDRLERTFKEVGFGADDVCFILATCCGDSEPTPAEYSACSINLRNQLSICAADYVVTFGIFNGEIIKLQGAIADIHGKVYAQPFFDNRPRYVMYSYPLDLDYWDAIENDLRGLKSYTEIAGEHPF